MLRFAPTTTGDMNIEDLRTALLNYIVATQKNENLIIRIGDIDNKNNIEGKDQEILDILNLFGITYSQVIYQSQNYKFYSAMALQLLHEKKAFACFCSDNWLEKKHEEAKIENKPYIYDDACRNLPPELVIDNTNPFTVRIIRPDEAIVFHDDIKGKLIFEPDEVDSFVIMNRDKTPTHNFACAVDDMLNDISIIIRNEVHINDTPKQIHVRNSLGYEKIIEFAHLPPILCTEETPGIKDLLELGYLPDAISNYLISLGYKTPKEIFTLHEAINWFALDTISKSPARFDIETLKSINKEHLKLMEAKELSRYVGFADAEIGELARIYLDEVDTTVALKSKIAPIFKERIIPEHLETEADIAINVIKTAPYFDEYDDFRNHISRETELEEENLLLILRLLLTNAEHGPELSEVYKYLKNYLGEIIK